MSRPAVAVIGAGVSGLCAGIYLQASGYQARVFEQAAVAGGLCASWRRQGYTFDGCVHWMLGSGPGSAFHPLWRELLDLDALHFVDHDEVIQMELRERDPQGSPIFHLWARIDRLERYLLELAPEDRRWIRSFCAAARGVQRFELPPQAGTAPELLSIWQKMGMIRLLPFLWTAWRWGRVSNLQLARRTRSPFLREALEAVYDGQEHSMLVLLMQIAWYDQRAAGFPLGGSGGLTRGLERRLLDLGGELRCAAPVERVLVRDGRACGVRLAGGEEVEAAAVLSAADMRWTLYEALEGRYLSPAQRRDFEEGGRDLFPSLLYVSLGVRRDLSALPVLIRWPLPVPLVLPCGTRVGRLTLHCYAYDPSLAPAGCTMANLMIDCREDAYWVALRRDDRGAYDAAKRQVAEQVIAAVEARFGDFAAHVEAVDVATPATFARWTRNWRGAYQGWLPGDLLARHPPAELPGLDRFRLIGQWTSPGGGLPPAMLSARNAVQVLCHRDGMGFLSQLRG